jgi:hypothetical protein
MRMHTMTGANRHVPHLILDFGAVVIIFARIGIVQVDAIAFIFVMLYKSRHKENE